MIPNKVKALFKLIDFLVKSKKEYIEKYIPLTNEAIELSKQMGELNPQTNYKDKKQYDLIQKGIEDKFNPVYNNVTLPILEVLQNLQIWKGENGFASIYNNNIGAINELKEKFTDKDIEKIIEYKQKYLSFRAEVNSNFLSLEFMFDKLDKVLKSLFDFFKDTDKNEFEALEPKTIQVNYISEAFEQFKQGYEIAILPSNFSHQTENKTDARFWLTTFFEEQEQAKQEYKSIQRLIENNGYFTIKTETDTVKVYTPEMAVILISKELPAQNLDTQKVTKINGWDYFKTYIEAYKEGERYFENEFKVSPNTLYGTNAEQYVRDIHLNFFHIKHTGIKEGWTYVKKQYPIILTHKEVKEFGYYSGIVNKVEEQVKKYPKQFATFENCEHNLPPQQTETTEGQETTTELKSIIKNQLSTLKNIFNTDADFQNAIIEIDNFFTSSSSLKRPIFVKNNNIKNLAFALGEIWRTQRNDVINYEYLKFYKKTFSIFGSQEIDKQNIFGSNLYKYSISKT